MNALRLIRRNRTAATVFHKYLTKLAPKNYETEFRASIANPEEFWAAEAEQIKWYKRWDEVLSNREKPDAKWFSGGELNTAFNCLDRHVEDGFGEQLAVIYDSPVTKTSFTMTYKELLNQVSLFAGVLSRQCNVQKGDRVLIYMPMVVECLVAMLACARIGAVHAVVFGGFSAEQLASRITSAEPKVIVTASYGKEKQKLIAYKPAVDLACELAGNSYSVRCRILYNRPEFNAVPLDKDRGWLDWSELMSTARVHDPVPVEANHPLYILYTSGTTGIPKGIVRTNGGHAVALKYAMSAVLGMKNGDRWWPSSEFGWVVGHSFMCYGPLLHRCTPILYEGKPVHTPDAAQFFRVLHEHKVNGWYTTPSALRAIRQEDPGLVESKHYRERLPHLRQMFVVGEHCDTETLSWIGNGLPDHVRITDSWWQTETGWPMTSCCFGLPGGYLRRTKIASPPGSAGRPVPGYSVQTGKIDKSRTANGMDFGQDDQELDRIVVKLPLPPGTASTFWNDHDRFLSYYFTSYPGYYDTMDVGHIDKDGFVYILSRADDVINVAGHRLSTSAIEEACYKDEDVIDCAVIAVPDQIKGKFTQTLPIMFFILCCVPFGLLVIKTECGRSEDEIVQNAIAAVRRAVGPVAAFHLAAVVPGLPKTRSGKIARGSLANMAAGKPIRIPPTIEDPNMYLPIYEVFKKNGMKPTRPP
ncbi:hypothetical protein P879_06771 [Paragonimus westermani]|uniref:Acyl-CoA synthetase short-chain family member 3, mitochondrial n=1 Tax=Paragonimus westermani TaxID=34504 RepID=A0A8T0DAQ8_9TREM|nr:hypothetical protein P879_06771 [Paragonimus westermani]